MMLFSEISSTSSLGSVAREKQRMTFSIEEILKPSFGCKQSQALTAETEDTRKQATVDRKLLSDTGHHKAAESPNHSLSTDKLSNISSTPRRGGDSGGKLSNSSSTPRRGGESGEDSDICDNNVLSETCSISRQDTNTALLRSQQIFTLGKLRFIASSHYYNTLSQMCRCGFLPNNLFQSFEATRRILNSNLTYSNLCSSQPYPSSSHDYIKDLNCFTASNNSPNVSKFTKSCAKIPDVIAVTKNKTESDSDAIFVKNSGTTDCSDSPMKWVKTTSKMNSTKNSLTENETATISSDLEATKFKQQKNHLNWPAWVYCTRYSDRPSSGPRYRKPRRKTNSSIDKRSRTAFSTHQLQRLRHEFDTCPYLSENRRQTLALELGLNESQVKIWFQNKRAKLKKSSGSKNVLAQRLMEEGLYNHSTVVVGVDDDNDDGDDKHSDLMR